MFCFLQTYVEENSRQNKFRMNDCVISLKRFYFFFLKNINYLDETERLTRTSSLFPSNHKQSEKRFFFFIFHLESVFFFFNFRLDGKFNPLRESYYQDGRGVTVLTSGWYEVKGHGVISRAGHKKDMKPSEICGFDSRGLKKELKKIWAWHQSQLDENVFPT